MKRLGRKNRPFYRICATDARSPRDGKIIEELGHYDPMVKETDARAVLNRDRIDYWLSVGALPSEKVGVLIKKYGTNGTHLTAQEQAMSRLKARPSVPEPIHVPLPVKDGKAAAAPQVDSETADADSAEEELSDREESPEEEN